KGRPEDWQSQLALAPVAYQVRAAAAAGFAGIVVDRFGYDDGGASTESELRTVLGGGPLVSADKRMSFFDLRRYGRHLRAILRPASLASLRAGTLRPVRSDWSEGFYGLEQGGGHGWYWSDAPVTRIALTNPAKGSRTVRFVVLVKAPTSSPELTVVYP